MIFAPVAGLLGQKIARPLVMLLGCIFMVPSLLMIGLSELPSILASVPLTLLGIFSLGFSGALISPMIVPELVDVMQEKFGQSYRAQISDYASAAYT